MMAMIECGGNKAAVLGLQKSLALTFRGSLAEMKGAHAHSFIVGVRSWKLKLPSFLRPLAWRPQLELLLRVQVDCGRNFWPELLTHSWLPAWYGRVFALSLLLHSCMPEKSVASPGTTSSYRARRESRTARVAAVEERDTDRVRELELICRVLLDNDGWESQQKGVGTQCW